MSQVLGRPSVVDSFPPLLLGSLHHHPSLPPSITTPALPPSLPPLHHQQSPPPGVAPVVAVVKVRQVLGHGTLLPGLVQAVHCCQGWYRRYTAGARAGTDGTLARAGTDGTLLVPGLVQTVYCWFQGWCTRYTAGSRAGTHGTQLVPGLVQTVRCLC